MHPRQILSTLVAAPLDSLASIRQLAADIRRPRAVTASQVPEANVAAGSAEAVAGFVVRVLAGGWPNC